MDRRSWLWRSKTSDKSSGETESLGSGSGSLSSPSEKFLDEQQVYPIRNEQSQKLTSNHAEDIYDSMKILSEKLSAAVSTIDEKEELVKQHAKVAEEAVTGWELAENEMSALKQQLDAALKKNSALEDKVIHLDGALKECLRQLRQVREEQDGRIPEAVGQTSENTDSTSSELQGQLEILNDKLASVEKENVSLQYKLHSQLEELKVRGLERDLSTKRAETVSKQHLESIKRLSKLGAECRLLKAMARKGASFNDYKSPSDNRLDTRKLDGIKPDKYSSKNHTTSKTNVGFMDDFLEMEKVASLPMQESGNDFTLLKAELDAMINRTVELEERIEMGEAEKVELGMTLTQCQDNLKECQNQLKMSESQLKDANKKIELLQAELDLAGELRRAIDLELDDANVRREHVENESSNLLNKVAFLEGEVEKERAMYYEASEKCGDLEDELSTLKVDAKACKNQLLSLKESKEGEITSLIAKIGSLENKVEKERRLSAEFESRYRKLETELSRTKDEAGMWQSQLISVNSSKEEVRQELDMAKTKKVELERQLEGVQEEANSLLAKVSSLEHEMDKERNLSSEFAAKCRKLEDELSKMKSEVDIRFAPLSKEELDKQQEKELAVAASKLAECQKTIASLGNQLESLATLEDLFLDSDNQFTISDKYSRLPTVKSDSQSSGTDTLNSFSSGMKVVDDNKQFAKVKETKGLSSVLVVKSHKNGFGKLIPRSRSTVKTRIS